LSSEAVSSSWKEALLGRGGDAAVAQKVSEAVERLLAHDADLLILDVSERAITGKLAGYLRSLFPEWHVDCEYNRDGQRAKIVTGQVVVPDVVIHRRGKPENLLVIEVKKSNSRESDERDMEKLAAFTSELGYANALFLKFVVGTGYPAVEIARWA
jgi:hypothetical protein